MSMPYSDGGGAGFESRTEGAADVPQSTQSMPGSLSSRTGGEWVW